MRDAHVDLRQATVEDMIALVNQAFKSCHSVLALSRSPLAASRIVQPALVRDDASPTAEERSHALFLALRWAVDKLAPGPVLHPFGDYRPLDDPTWHDPRWWRYNILRHRYLEPIHPDDFVEGGRFTETLIALTGLPTTDAFFDERGRAIREVTQWLHRQLHEGEADAELERLAVAEVYGPLQREKASAHLMDLASTFDAIFPRPMLLDLAAAEGVHGAGQVLDRLIQRRDLLGDQADQAGHSASLWMGPALRRYIYARSERPTRRMRHDRIARAFEKIGDRLAAARHYRLAEQPSRAAHLLLAAAEQITDELDVTTLLAETEELAEETLPGELGYRLMRHAADLYRMVGDHDQAIAACRTALQRSDDSRHQGQIYRRLGKLYEQRNQSHAINYYRQALERLDPGEPEVAEVLKDRGWLHLLRRDWTAAADDLHAALTHRRREDIRLEAEIYDALSSLARRQGNFDDATQHARTALALRESQGDALGVAKSLGNLGLIYNDQGDYAHAIAAYNEAAITYGKLGNRELTLTALLNVGLAQHLSGLLDDAIATYHRCLAQGAEIGNQLTVVMTHSNLAEAYAQQGAVDAARRHWQIGFALGQRYGFDDETEYYVELSQQFEALSDLAGLARPVATTAEAPQLTSSLLHEAPMANAPETGVPAPTMPPDLDPQEQVAWSLANESGSVTAKDLVDAAHVSKPTATRKLAGLVERGILVKYGQGRGTYYALVAAEAGLPAEVRAAALTRRLADQRFALGERFDVTALALRQSASDLATLVARFGALPDLLTFFRLEQELTAICSAPVRLVPEAALGVPATESDLIWLWA